MDKVREIMSDPAKLEQSLRAAFDKVDAEKKGYITFEALMVALQAQAQAVGYKRDKPPTEEEKAEAKKIADPEGNNKITFENFKKFMIFGLEKKKAEGKF